MLQKLIGKRVSKPMSVILEINI